MAEDPIKTILHYAQALKAPRIRESARLAEQARDAGWTHEEHLAAVLSREVAAREASGAATRIRSAQRNELRAGVHSADGHELGQPPGVVDLAFHELSELDDSAFAMAPSKARRNVLTR